MEKMTSPTPADTSATFEAVKAALAQKNWAFAVDNGRLSICLMIACSAGKFPVELRMIEDSNAIIAHATFVSEVRVENREPMYELISQVNLGLAAAGLEYGENNMVRLRCSATLDGVENLPDYVERFLTRIAKNVSSVAPSLNAISLGETVEQALALI